MSSNRRLRLDEVVASYPELGPTVPDGGYAWIVLCGVFLVQMTVPSVLPMYGVVLARIREIHVSSIEYIWYQQIVLTPILFSAFWTLADPWSRIVVSMAPVPCLIGIIGVMLMVVGIIASGYLATGGVGAYLASTSAGAVMGIGASFVMLLSDHVLRKFFRRKLLVALTLRNVGTSFGFVIIPCITSMLLHEASLKTGLQLMTAFLLLPAIGTTTFRLPLEQQASPYSLLLSTEEDTELPVRIPPDLSSAEDLQKLNGQRQDLEDDQEAERSRIDGQSSGDGSNMYAYEDFDEDVDLFVNPILPDSDGKWKQRRQQQQFQMFKNCRFWFAIIGWVGMKVSFLFFWILLPILAYECYHAWISVSVTAGCSTLLPNLISCRVLKLTSQYRRLYFGMASWLCGVGLIGLGYASNYWWLTIFTFLGGVSIGSLSSCEDVALYDVLGTETVRSVHKGFSTVVGLCMLLFCFARSTTLCLSLAALLQFLGGLLWISSPALNLILKITSYSSARAKNRARVDGET